MEQNNYPDYTNYNSRNTNKKYLLYVAAATGLILIVLISAVIGGVIALYLNPDTYSFLGEPAVQHNLGDQNQEQISQPYLPQTTTEERITQIGEEYVDSIVAIVAKKDLPTFEQCFISPFPGFSIPDQCPTGSTESTQTGSGSGFVVADNIILTNKHVVADRDAQYSVITYENKTLDAEVITRDPIEDLALLRVDNLNLESVQLGDSDNITVGQIVVAVGNALGQFENSFSFGIISGLKRTIIASNGLGGRNDTLQEIIQTDAAINPGNSGGPLFNLSGDVIGVNVAYAAQANSISFAVPINRIKKTLQQVIETGKVEYPFLGISYISISSQVKEEYDLPLDNGAFIISETGTPAILRDSSAQKAGLQNRDIITHINNTPIDKNNPLSSVLRNFSVGDQVQLRVHRQGDSLTLTATLQARPNNV